MSITLTREEEEILQGKQSEIKKISMEILLRVGELFGAKRLVPIKSAHVHGHYGSLHDAGVEVLEKFASLGAMYCVPTTINPSSVSAEGTELPISSEYIEKQRRLRIAHEAMRVIPTWSCCPYYDFSPKLGDNVAWAESSAISFANSILGARTNRMSTGLEISAAVIGKIPEFGLYIMENRQPEILVEIQAKICRQLDYHSLGFLLGKLCKRKIPYIDSMLEFASFDNLKCLGASAASSGALELYHMRGITAEVKARQIETHKSYWSEHFIITDEDLKTTEQNLTTAENEVDIVMLGCPHYSVDEMNKLAAMLQGKKVSNKSQLWVYTTSRVKAISKGNGTLSILENAGVRVISGTCSVISPLSTLGIKAVMVNSGKAANVIPSEHGIEVAYASTEECVATAIRGERMK